MEVYISAAAGEGGVFYIRQDHGGEDGSLTGRVGYFMYGGFGAVEPGHQ